jgi:hypothetical protein
MDATDVGPGESEREELKMMLLEDEELSTKSGLIYKIFESTMGTTWGTFLGFREVFMTLF